MSADSPSGGARRERFRWKAIADISNALGGSPLASGPR
jgi:hypothetical protein